jgi:hypothetical protein
MNMDISVFDDGQLPTVFRTLRTALTPESALEPAEHAFLEAYAEITGYSLPAATPAPIAPRDVHIEGAHQRKRLVQLAAMAVMLHRPVRVASVAFVRDLAAHLDVAEPVLPVLSALLKGRKRTARLLTTRRGMAGILAEAHRAEGTWGVIRFVSALWLGARVNRDKPWKYKRLGLLPEGTLGREYWKHLTALGFAFPGEPAGIPDTVAYHDIAHVLADNDTSPLGEIQQGSFQGGNRRQDGFFFVQFVILHFHQGIQITPAAGPDVGHFDPKKVLWAIHRGASCPVDMTHQWDYWPLMSLPLSEARERCGILPKAA